MEYPEKCPKCGGGIEIEPVPGPPDPPFATFIPGPWRCANGCADDDHEGLVASLCEWEDGNG